MSPVRPTLAAMLLGIVPGLLTAGEAEGPAVSQRARDVHAAGLLIDGHNDLPWLMRSKGDMNFQRFDLSRRLDGGHTDIPRLREGGVKAQFWSVYIPSGHPEPARTVTQQIDLVRRMVEGYPDTFAMAYSADDIERVVAEGKIASLIGIEGGVAIENDLAQLRAFHALGARYMTLTHNVTLDWADAATDVARNGGLSPRGEQVVREMNRLGMLVDISHVSPGTMDDVLRVSKAPVIASHSSAYGVAPHPRNVPDEILRRLPENGGVVMVNFFSGFIVPSYARALNEARARIQAEHKDPKDASRALLAWMRANPRPRGTIAMVADHIDHIIDVAGIDHVGIGSDFDGINSSPEGLEDVSCFPRLTEELLRRGRSESDVHKILGGNVLRAFRRAGEVAVQLRATTPPEVDPRGPEEDD